MSDPWFVALKVSITLWLVGLSVWDHLHRRVPNWLVLPVMGGAFVWQAYASIVTGAKTIGFVAVAWVVLFLLWRAHVFGGGDSKFLMALFALFPSVQFLIFFSLVVLVVSVPLLVIQAIRTRSLPFRRSAGGQLGLPTDEDLRRRGRPYCWTLALPGAIYLWWVL